MSNANVAAHCCIETCILPNSVIRSKSLHVEVCCLMCFLWCIYYLLQVDIRNAKLAERQRFMADFLYYKWWRFVEPVLFRVDFLHHNRWLHHVTIWIFVLKGQSEIVAEYHGAKSKKLSSRRADTILIRIYIPEHHVTYVFYLKHSTFKPVKGQMGGPSRFLRQLWPFY